ncbi:MAG: aryl-sulfate sulfotransferase [Saprospiraceae bacterium]|nr:aryl-sulfate sulfotransferase [Candidatus Vicinibacter affinis]
MQVFDNQIIAQKWGYVTMIAPGNSNTVNLLDTNSLVVKSWNNLSGKTAYSSHLMPGGILWRSVGAPNAIFRGGGITGRIQKVDWDGKILFDYTISDNTQCAHHDFCPLPNGNVLVIVYELKSAAESSAKGGPNASRYSEKLIELRPTGVSTAEIVWEWHLWDHLCQNTNPALSNYVSSLVNTPHMLNINYLNNKNDWVHMNGVDYNEELDQIVLSSHFLNEMWVIDHSLSKAETALNKGGRFGVGGGFLYRWGNPATYGAQGPVIFKVMHDAHWVPKDAPRAGFLAAVNNQGVSNNQTAADYFESTWDGKKYSLTPGQAYLPANYSFRHAANGYTSNMGSSQELPNGNLLICLATASKVYEVDSFGKQLWLYQGNAPIPQAFRYSKCFIENLMAIVSASSTSINQGESTNLNCTIVSTAATGINYSWSPAEGLSNSTVANPVAMPAVTTTYSVTATSSAGCSTTGTITIVVKSNGLEVDVSAIDSIICLGEITQLNSKLSGSNGNPTYEWTSNPVGFNSNLPDPFINPEKNTWYFLKVTENGNTALDSILIQVNPLPLQPSITKEDSLLVSSADIGNQWFFYGNPIDSANSKYLLPKETGSYQVQIVDSNGCASILSDPFEFIHTLIKDINLMDTWTYFPNPTTDKVNIITSDLESNYCLILVDQLGRVVKKIYNVNQFSVGDLFDGVYNLVLQTEKSTSFKKLIVTH